CHGTSVAHTDTLSLPDALPIFDELELDDLTVRSCIRTGYDALRSGGGPVVALAVRAFRALGVLHAPDAAPGVVAAMLAVPDQERDRKSTRLNSSHVKSSYPVFC